MNLLPPPSGAFLHSEDGISGCPGNVGPLIPYDTVSVMWERQISRIVFLT